MITAYSPAGTGTVDVTVTTPGGTSATSTADQFTYAPTISSISPTAGTVNGGTVVTITGTGFAGATAVEFGTTQATAFTVVSPTVISASSPPGTGAVGVTVTTSNGTSATSPAAVFTYQTAPTLTGISPTTGPLGGGTLVTISGTGFTGATAVDFGTNPATSLKVLSDTTVTVDSPAGTGTLDVTVTSPGGTSATSPADQFTYQAAPTVTSINPTFGPASGTTLVTIDGTGFTGATAVDFGTNPATDLTSVSATSITAMSPAGTETVDVTVTTPGGVSATSPADQFTYAPTVTSISPTSGPLAGGTLVTITGTGFTGASAVDFGTTPATTFTVGSATTITALSPAGTGSVGVTVMTPSGTSATSTASQFTYEAAPTVAGISPIAGPLGGGTPVTIIGTGFTGATVVDFGTSPATNLDVVNDTTITANSPAGTGTVDVTVTSPGGTSATSTADQFTYEAAPTVTGVSPTFGPAAGGTLVTITGTGFADVTAVDFGTSPATDVTVVSNIMITGYSPAGTGAVDVTVTTPGGTSAASPADRFTYAPTVSGISPIAGPLGGGTLVTITGTGFTGATAVMFGINQAASVTVVSASTITALSPAGTGSVGVTVMGPGGTSAISPADVFTYQPAPTVTGLSPTAGPLVGGTLVTITGTGFTRATAVDFGTNPATNVTVVSDTTITADSPAGTAGTVDVTVTAPGGMSTPVIVDQFTYVAAPIVSGVSPNHGPAAGDTLVTITGSGFTGVTGVDFGTTQAPIVSSESGNTIMVYSPAGTSARGRDRDDFGWDVRDLAGRCVYVRADCLEHQPYGRASRGRHFGNDHRDRLYRCLGGRLRRDGGDGLHRRRPCHDHGGESCWDRQRGGDGDDAERDVGHLAWRCIYIPGCADGHGHQPDGWSARRWNSCHDHGDRLHGCHGRRLWHEPGDELEGRQRHHDHCRQPRGHRHRGRDRDEPGWNLGHVASRSIRVPGRADSHERQPNIRSGEWRNVSHDHRVRLHGCDGG